MFFFKTLSSAVCYFLFNWQFFRCVESFLPVQPLSKRKLLESFFWNFGVFFLCSALELHLIANWSIFFILLLAEQLFFYHQPFRSCLLLALLSTQLGLATNIFFRSLIAILLNVPLIAFDNNTLDIRNMKAYPVFLGFLLAGLIFWMAARLGTLKKLSPVLNDRKTLVFLLSLLSAMYIYLCMNLIVYYVPQNNLVLKLWSMKSSVFVVLGEYLSIILAGRMGELAGYRAKNQESRKQMAQEKARESELRALATTDPLTGCENRLQAQKRLQDALDSERSFCLCFVDLNGLKFVNDNFGHEMGDSYLIAVTNALQGSIGEGNFLFRYGGDEFLLLLFGKTVSETAAILQKVQKKLEEETVRQAYSFPMSISYGISTSDDSAAASDLIQIADSRMYEMKSSSKGR